MPHSSPYYGLLLFRCNSKVHSFLPRFLMPPLKRTYYIPPGYSVFYQRIIKRRQILSHKTQTTCDGTERRHSEELEGLENVGADHLATTSESQSLLKDPLHDRTQEEQIHVSLRFATPINLSIEASDTRFRKNLVRTGKEILKMSSWQPRVLFDEFKKLSSPHHILLRVMVLKSRQMPPSSLAKDASIATSNILQKQRTWSFELQEDGSWTERERLSCLEGPNHASDFKVIVSGPFLNLAENVVKQPSPVKMEYHRRDSESWGSSEIMNDIVPLFTQLKLSYSQHQSESALSLPTIGQKLAGLAFEIADKLEPSNNVNFVSLKLMKESVVFAASREHGYGKFNYQRLVECNERSAHRAFIAFGSNIGDRFSMIETALKEMEKLGLKIVGMSSLWETAPMYVTDQESFINGVCEIETSAQPVQLLRLLQGIETSMGRVKVTEKGPRNIDLDILLYDKLVTTTEDLTIPHPRIPERDFVLWPLCELIPSERLPPPRPSSSFEYYLGQLSHHTRARPIKTVPLSSSASAITPLEPTRSTQIMAVLNVTPDSFSDGGVHSPQDLDAIYSTVRGFISSGATIIDVGGQSTRPGAMPLNEDDEIARVVPVIKKIRSIPEAANIAISIDTFRARVAEEAVKAGADVINDVSAGTLDDQMFPTAAKLGTTIILMHMRGTPETMPLKTNYPEGVITGVGKELLQRVKAAEAAGIRPWRIILDPGIGFAKNQKQNLEILRRMPELREFKGLKGYPWLVGTSRKSFIGRITSMETPSERTWGTAAAVTESIRGGADIVRVHDVPEMAQVAKMADAIWRVEEAEPRRGRLIAGEDGDSEGEDGEGD